MKVSVITVCKNSLKHIERCIRSVLSQSYGDLEYIIIDGESTDGTLSVINQFISKIDILISESDTGVYDAMNKGLKHAKGDIIYFLNSDDYFHDDDVVMDVFYQFMRSDYLIVYGDIILVEGNKESIIKYDNISKKYFYHNTICHQAIFSKKTLFDDMGFFDVKYKIYSDVDWLLRVYKEYRPLIKHMDRIICYFSYEGMSSKAYYDMRYVDERIQILSKHFFTAKLKVILKPIMNRLGISNIFSSKIFMNLKKNLFK